MTHAIEKLPKWAQQIVERLEHRVNMLEAALDLSKGDAPQSRLTVNPYGHTDARQTMHLQPYDTVGFDLGKTPRRDCDMAGTLLANVEFDRQAHEWCLVFRGVGKSLLIRPEASNAARIFLTN